jgi:hypothetical protein
MPLPISNFRLPIEGIANLRLPIADWSSPSVEGGSQSVLGSLGRLERQWK